MLRYHVGGIVKTYLSDDGLNSHDLFSKSLSQCHVSLIRMDTTLGQRRHRGTFGVYMLTREKYTKNRTYTDQVLVFYNLLFVIRVYCTEEYACIKSIRPLHPNAEHLSVESTPKAQHRHENGRTTRG